MHEQGLERARKRMNYLGNKMSVGQVPDFQEYYKKIRKKESETVSMRL